MDAYLCRFERFATIAVWSETGWATSLNTLLAGNALDVYSRMPIEKSSDYESLKCALLFKYQLTAEGFGTKFRSAKLETIETYSQLTERLNGYLKRWVELSGKEKKYDDLVDLLLQEQLLRLGGKELAVFLQERKPSGAKEMAKLADKYQEAHMSYNRSGKKSGHGSTSFIKFDWEQNVSNKSESVSASDGAK